MKLRKTMNFIYNFNFANQRSLRNHVIVIFEYVLMLNKIIQEKNMYIYYATLQNIDLTNFWKNNLEKKIFVGYLSRRRLF